MVDKVLKDLKKKGQEAMIQNILAPSMTLKSMAKKQKAEKTGETELTSVKDQIKGVSTDIGQSVSGQFGKKVKESFKTQQGELDKF